MICFDSVKILENVRMSDSAQFPQGVLRKRKGISISWYAGVEFEYRNRTSILLDVLGYE